MNRKNICEDVTSFFAKYNSVVKMHTGIDIINVLFYISSIDTLDKLVPYLENMMRDDEILISTGLFDARDFVKESHGRFLFMITNYESNSMILPRGVHLRDYSVNEIRHSFSLSKNHWIGEPFITHEAELLLDEAVKRSMHDHRGEILEKRMGI